MTHGKDCPDRCSQCLGVKPRKVTTQGAELLIDGQPCGRTLDAEVSITARKRARR
jgi:hypothetical protein